MNVLRKTRQLEVGGWRFLFALIRRLADSVPCSTRMSLIRRLADSEPCSTRMSGRDLVITGARARKMSGDLTYKPDDSSNYAIKTRGITAAH